MDDLDMLARDFGFGPRGKSNPMRSDSADRSHPAARSSFDDPLFNDVFGGPSKYSPSLNSNANSSKQSVMSDFDYDSIFKSSEPKIKNSSSKTSSSPVYDKPVYDDDIFDGLPGLKSKPASSTLKSDNDSFATSKSGNNHRDFDDLLDNLGRNERVGKSNKRSTVKKTSDSQNFDDLLGGLGSSSSAAGDRPLPQSTWGSPPAVGSTISKHGPTVTNDPFVVLERDSVTGSSSSRLFTDTLEDIGKLEKSRSTSAEVSSGSGEAFDDLDPLNDFGNPLNPYSSERETGVKDGRPSKSTMRQSVTTREQKGNSSFGYSESNSEKKVHLDHSPEPPLFDMPNASADFQKSFDQTASSPTHDETGAEADIPYSSSGQGQQSDDIWLTVSEIPLFTQPTNAPPPSRPPPSIPRQAHRSEGTYFFSISNKKDGVVSPPSYSEASESPKVTSSAARGSTVSLFDELDDFAKGFSRNSVDESTHLHSDKETNALSSAAASAAAMKDAMDKAEAKFRHAKEVREREYAKVAKLKESISMEKVEQDWQDGEFRETQERVDSERKQKEEEEEEREQRKLEREREIEREKARQAVGRATREARERAATEARERAASEARLRNERAAVQRAQAEARERAAAEAKERAERAAVEARERAAAEAKERAERAAVEARERAAAEAREMAAAAEAREKEAANRASSEARRRAERAAFERASAEARERAVAEARERAAAAAKINPQKNDNDLDSIFGMGRASSAPRTREKSNDPMFNQQFPSKAPASSGISSNMKRPSSTTNIIDDLSSIFGAAPSAGEFVEVEGETDERRRARLERHQRTQERAAKALAEKNNRDVQAKRDQEERHRIAETLDIEIKRWAAGKEGNLRALLSTLQYVLWPECGWQPVSLTDLIIGVSVKKAYRKATLCIHPDKVQQKGATLQQKYIAEKVFDLLKEAWNKFNSEELY